MDLSMSDLKKKSSPCLDKFSDSSLSDGDIFHERGFGMFVSNPIHRGLGPCACLCRVLLA